MNREEKPAVGIVNAQRETFVDTCRAVDSVGLGLLFSFYFGLLFGALCLGFFLFQVRLEVLFWPVTTLLVLVTVGLAGLRMPFAAAGLWLGLVLGVGILGLLLIGSCGLLMYLIGPHP